MCTDIRLWNPGGFHISARNLDYSEALNTWTGVVPKGTAFHSIAPKINQERALAWTTKCNYITMISMPATYAGLPTAPIFNALPPELKAVGIDGLNDSGLAAAALWDDGADFPDPSTQSASHYLANMHLVEWILGNFVTVAEVKAAITDPAGPAIWSRIDLHGQPWSLLPMHFVVHDAAGNDLVVEARSKCLTFPSSGAGVLTNEPGLDWHHQNLSAYVNLSFTDAVTKLLPNGTTGHLVGGDSITPQGCGSGMLGLPGDFTPISRFVRATFMNLGSASCRDLNTPDRAAAHALHIITACAPTCGLNKTPGDEDHTYWQAVRDHDRLRYYVRPYWGMRPLILDLKALDWGKVSKADYVSLTDNQAVSSQMSRVPLL